MNPYLAYENFKREILQYNLTPQQYETALIQMAGLLNI